jgi:hypothetical protein
MTQIQNDWAEVGVKFGSLASTTSIETDIKRCLYSVRLKVMRSMNIGANEKAGTENIYYDGDDDAIC